MDARVNVGSLPWGISVHFLLNFLVALYSLVLKGLEHITPGPA